MLSVFGLIIVLGIIVDDAIVIGENIYSHRRKGESLVDSSVRGTIEVMPCVTASVTTTVIATDEVMPGVISLPHGWGHKKKGVKMSIATQQQGVNCNKLTDNKQVDRLSGNAILNGVPVTVEAADRSAHAA